MKKSILLAVALTSLIPGGAQARERGPRPDPYGDATVSRLDAAAKAGQDFDKLDTNHDGYLSDDEMAATLPDIRMRTFASRINAVIDTDKDGKVSKEEFVAMALQRFDRADADHDGQLTKAERDAAREAMRARFRDRMQSGGFGNDRAPPPPDDRD